MGAARATSAPQYIVALPNCIHKVLLKQIQSENKEQSTMLKWSNVDLVEIQSEHQIIIKFSILTFRMKSISSPILKFSTSFISEVFGARVWSPVPNPGLSEIQN